VAGGGENDINAGPGNDVIDARNGQQDTIDCGDGVDTVIVDSQENGVFNCENVVYPPGP
jgi:Ca2+-binding RTX toxin-like protein